MNSKRCFSTRAFTLTLFLVLALLAPLAGHADSSRYVIKGGEVYDKETDLTWQRCSVGLRWKEDRCIGIQKRFTWEPAQKQATKGWRVPSKDELISLIDMKANFDSYHIDTDVFADMKYGYGRAVFFWSSTPSADHATKAWGVAFCCRAQEYEHPRNFPDAGVRLVRTGK